MFAERLREDGIDILPVLAATNAQIGGVLDGGFFRARLADPPGILLTWLARNGESFHDRCHPTDCSGFRRCGLTA